MTAIITEIEFINYRGFRRHTVPFRETTIVVGKNNAGKSTITEALGLIGITLLKVRTSRFISPPEWLDLPKLTRGFSPSLRGLDFEFRNLCHRYSDPPAAIRASFNDDTSLEIFLNPETEEVFAILRDEDGSIITDKFYAKPFLEKRINVLPPVGRMNIRERVLQEDYVRSNLNSNLAPLHFRNQLHYLGSVSMDGIQYEGDYDRVETITRYLAFTRLAEATWPQLKIESFEASGQHPKDLSLLVRDGSFVAEVGWVGNGLQAWLQTCWFLARCPFDCTLVLDEPDVFLHADIQRKLIRLVKGQFGQVVIATHSLEILSEVDPSDVLVIDKQNRKSGFAEDLPAVQSVINNIGGANNLQLMRLWAAKKCIFIEGDDLEFLSAFHETIFPNSDIALSALPHISIGGFTNWKLAIGAAIGLRNAGDVAIQAYCILDTDFRSEDENKKILDEAHRNGLNLHIWRKKEIENYVLVPEAITRFIELRKRQGAISIDKVIKQMERVCQGLRDETFDSFSTEIWRVERQGATDANRKARAIVNEAWKSFEGKVALCSGKKIVSALSAWAQKSYGVSFSALALAREMNDNEIGAEVQGVITAIEKSKSFVAQKALL